MPAFTFEKLSPPGTPASAPVREAEQRGYVGRIVNRLVGRRASNTKSDAAEQLTAKLD